MPFRTLRCDIFCRVVDNFGDAAVCWRLAHGLQAEQDMDVRLVIDKPSVLAALRPDYDPALARQWLNGVRVEHAVSRHEFPAGGGSAVLETADIVIEAFGGGLPEGYAQALAARRPAGIWIVLEYLSAEDWVAGHHGLASPHPSLDVRRFFFFPGFATKTGGLLREPGVVEARAAFDRESGARAAVWAMLGQPAPDPGERVVSLFGYANDALPGLLEAMVHGPEPTVLALAPGALADATVGWLSARGAGFRSQIARAGRLQVRALPFLAQADYDRLLLACDFNFVRGEDSLLRAIWAGRPLAWHLYPQSGQTHCVKLEAFLHTVRERVALPCPPAGADCVGDMDAAAADALAVDALDTLQRAWNVCACDPGHAPAARVARQWPQVAAALPRLSLHALRLAEALAAQTDLATRLAAFCRDQLK